MIFLLKFIFIFLLEFLLIFILIVSLNIELHLFLLYSLSFFCTKKKFIKLKKLFYALFFKKFMTLSMI